MDLANVWEPVAAIDGPKWTFYGHVLGMMPYKGEPIHFSGSPFSKCSFAGVMFNFLKGVDNTMPGVCQTSTDRDALKTFPLLDFQQDHSICLRWHVHNAAKLRWFSGLAAVSPKAEVVEVDSSEQWKKHLTEAQFTIDTCVLSTK